MTDAVAMGTHDEREIGSVTENKASSVLAGLPGGGLNIGYEAVDKHVAAGRQDVTALRCIAKNGDLRDVSYGELSAASTRFAGGLVAVAGDNPRVATVAGRIPELFVAALGTLKAGGTFTPLFAAFGPDPIQQRLELGNINVLVTTAALYRRKIMQIREALPLLHHVVLLDGATDQEAGTLGYEDLMAAAPETTTVCRTDADTLALVHFTSGTTGTPKGAMHVHGAVQSHVTSGRQVLDLRLGDVYWCTADPGWVTGTTYGIISPLCNGVTCILDEGGFDAERWYSVVEEHRVNVWYTAPTAIRMMMRSGVQLAHEHDLSSLRVVASVGEPLNPEAVRWGELAFDQPILDNWWQTETGSIMIANVPGMDVRRGSMGRPLPGIDAAIVQRGQDGTVIRGDDGNPVPVSEPGETGELALRSGWPSMFRGYLGEEERYQKCFVGEWYCSGDLARRDEDGYFWFVGRGDDVIKSAGHLIGPFEVESVLLEHPAVAEAGVIGKPDVVAGEVVKAFISLAPDFTEDLELIRDISGFARGRLGAAVAPREIQVTDSLPKTRSGKIVRRLLRARELGLPLGDTSTLEGVT